MPWRAPTSPRAQASSHDGHEGSPYRIRRCSATSCMQAVPSKSTRIDPTGDTGAGYRPGRMPMVNLERLGRAMAAALRTKILAVAGGEVAEIDGLEVCLSYLADPGENFAFVRTEPKDPDAALADAEEVLCRNGMPFGIGVLAGRHPSVDAAVRAAGHHVLFEEPTMTARVADLARVALPLDVRLAEAGPDDLSAAAALD